MFSRLGNLSVGIRLYAGFGVILAMLAGMAIIAVSGFHGLGIQFARYGEMAKDTQLVAELKSDITHLQLQVREYLAAGSKEELEQVRTAYVQADSRVKEALKEIQKPERAQLVAEIAALKEQYFKGFNRVSELFERRSALVNDALDPIGAEIRSKLTRISEEAYKDKDHQSANYAGVVQEDLLTARLYVTRFLNTNDAKDAARVAEEFKEVDEALGVLDRSLEDPARRAMLAAVKDALPRYRRAFDELVSVIGERNAVRASVLDTVGARILENAAAVAASANADMKALDKAVQDDVYAGEVEESVIALCAILLGLVITCLIGRGITRPINAMVAAMARLASKEWDAEVPALERRDEIGRMAGSVQVFKSNGIENERLQREAEEARQRRQQHEEEQRRLEEEAARTEARRQREGEEAERRAAELRRLEQERLNAEAERQRKAELARLADEFESTVNAVVRVVASSSTELQSSSASMSQTAERSSRQATTVAAASRQASASVQTVAAASEELASSIREIARQVGESSTMASHTMAQARSTGDTVEGLAQAAQKIGQVVQMITDIASQTNLLALNATIEAARAGDAGRGFSVVASEVKALASQTARATGDIARQIEQVQSATRDSVVAIQSIGQSIERVNSVAAAISAAVEEQGAATQEITRNVQQAASGTEDVTRNIVTVTRASGEVSAAAVQMNGTAAELARQATILSTEVDRFVAKVRAA